MVIAEGKNVTTVYTIK